MAEGQDISELSNHQHTLLTAMVKRGVLQIRDIMAGEEPFTYRSGQHGPGLLTIKGLVSDRHLLGNIITELSIKMYNAGIESDFIAAIADGAIAPGWELSARLAMFFGMDEVPCTYVLGERKAHGHSERIVGLKQNSSLMPGMRALLLDDTVNFGTSLIDGADCLRTAGYVVKHAAAIVTYGHEQGHLALAKADLTLSHLFSMAEILAEVDAQELYPQTLTDDYRAYLKDPIGWQTARGLPLPESVKST